MYTDLITISQQQSHPDGFWITKKHWKNEVAQILKVEHNSSSFIAMLMDRKSGEINEIVKLANPQAQDFRLLEQSFKPKYNLPESILEFILNRS